MAKITKSRGRVPIARGRLFRSYSTTAEGVSGFTLSVADEIALTPAGRPRFVNLQMSDGEAYDAMLFIATILARKKSNTRELTQAEALHFIADELEHNTNAIQS